MWPRLFERRIRPFLARELGPECAYGHLARESAEKAIVATLAEEARS